MSEISSSSINSAKFNIVYSTWVVRVGDLWAIVNASIIFDFSASCIFLQQETKAILYNSDANGAYISVREAQANSTGDGFYLSS